MKTLKKFFWPILLLIIIILSFFTLLRSGFFPMQDDMQVFRLVELDKCVKDLQLPCRWVPDAGFGYGYPQFNYYAPLVYYAGEAFHLSGLQYIDSTKIVIILGFVLGALGMYLLVNEFFGGFAGMVAGVLYTIAPYKAQEVYVRGSISEFFANLFFPLILWSIYKTIQKGEKRYYFFTALLIGGLFFTHNLFAFLFIPVIIFWAGFWLVVEKKIYLWTKIVAVLIAGFLISASFVLPVIFEKGYAHTETLLGGYFDYRQHFVTIQELFVSNHWGYGSSQLGPNDDLSLSTGQIHWIMGVLAVITAFFTFKKKRNISILILGLGVAEVFMLFLMHEKSSFIWSAISFLAWLQFPWRLLSFSVLILSFLAGYLVSNFGKARYFIGIAAIAAVLVLHGNFFKPQIWLNITDSAKLSGPMWDKELTASIFDYLPIYAKLPPPSKAPDLPEVLTGKAIFTNYFKGSDYQKGNLNVLTNARIRLPLFDFPGMTVYLNNSVVAHNHDNCSNEPFCMGLISFDAPKGDYKFSVKLQDTPIRTVGNIVSLLSLFGILIWFFKKDKRSLVKS